MSLCVGLSVCTTQGGLRGRNIYTTPMYIFSSLRTDILKLVDCFLMYARTTQCLWVLYISALSINKYNHRSAVCFFSCCCHFKMVSPKINYWLAQPCQITIITITRILLSKTVVKVSDAFHCSTVWATSWLCELLILWLKRLYMLGHSSLIDRLLHLGAYSRAITFVRFHVTRHRRHEWPKAFLTLDEDINLRTVPGTLPTVYTDVFGLKFREIAWKWLYPLKVVTSECCYWSHLCSVA